MLYPMRLIRILVAVAVSFAVSLAICAPAQQHDADQLLKNAIDAQQHGDYQKAIADYRKLLQLRPQAVDARVNLGAALVHVGQFDAAIAEYQSALASAPQNNAILLNLALAYYKKGDYENARMHFETLHRTEPKNVRIAVLLGDVDTRLGKPADAVALLEPMEAASEIAAEHAGPEGADLEYSLGAALIKTGRRRDGIGRVERAAALGSSADAYMLAGSTLLDIGEYEQARRDLDTALRLDPRLPGIYSLTGTARDKTGDVKGAESAFREALKMQPDDLNANLYLGAILYKRRDLAEARPYLERALELDPKSSMARYEGAMLKSASGEYEGAAVELEKLVHDDPRWLEPHVELATLYYKLHRPKDGARERQIVDQLTAEQQSKGPEK